MKGGENMTAEEVKTEAPKETKTAKTASGLEPNVAALLAYLFDFVGGLVFFLIEKDNKFVRFAAMQSLVLSVLYWAVFLVALPAVTFGFSYLLTPLFGLGYLVLRIVLMVKAYQNEEWEVPVVGKMARNFVK